MQTRFTKTKLKQPDIARADEILRKCVHCGFCTATCPTYLVTGDERDSPRGRIWMIRDLLEGNKDSAETTGYHLDRCLTCLSCMTTCPSGVDYMHLVDIGRQHADGLRPKTWADATFRKLIVGMLSHGRRAWFGLMLGWLARPFGAMLPRKLQGMLDAAPKSMPRLDPVGGSDKVYSPDTAPPKARVALLAGCAQRAVDRDINAATIRLLNRLGVEVVVRKDAYCCGALAHHTGVDDAAHDAMAATIRTWAGERKYRHLDAIIVNTSGCGTTIKDYGDRFAGDSTLADDAAMVSSLTLDITEYLDRIGLAAIDPKISAGLRVTYHSACSMQHGQRIRTVPQELLRRAGFEVLTPQESHICCGSAGTYSLLNPEISRELKERKTGHIDATGGDIVAAGNVGCMNQLQDSTAPVVHTVELLDWVTGGPKPRKLRGRV
ncbi:MAG: glycolate oxidase subunit GlcF [Candidatus Puniceispirillales bacterium]